MPFTLQNVVPWGRSYAEYIQMFGLTETDLEKRILGCSDGPASFNARHSSRGGNVVSLDPVYQFSRREIQHRIHTTSAQIYSQLRTNRSAFNWAEFGTPENLVKQRISTMNDFLDDFEIGKERGRYIAGELPELPFLANSFELALCSHFLLLYSEHLSFEFHLQSVLELLRISAELRIFPIVELSNEKSRHLDKLISELEDQDFQCSIESVEYEFQIGANQMLRIQKI